MPTSPAEFGSLRVHVSEPLESAPGTGLLVALLHGFGAPGTDLVGLAREVPAPPGTRFAFPEAPLRLPWGGDARAWWPVNLGALQAGLAGDHPDAVTEAVPAGLAEAHAAVLGCLQALSSAYEVPAHRIVLGGFSQGAILACDVTLCSPFVPAALVMLSGSLLSAGRWRAALPDRTGLPILVCHGRADPILPFAIASGWQEELAGAGARVTWVPFAGGHTVSAAVLGALGRFLRGHFPA